jgi:hypothetical protein
MESHRIYIFFTNSYHYMVTLYNDRQAINYAKANGDIIKVQSPECCIIYQNN